MVLFEEYEIALESLYLSFAVFSSSKYFRFHFKPF